MGDFDINKFQFGVEIEFTGITTSYASVIVANTLNSKDCNNDENEYEIIDSQDRIWEIKFDTSIVDTDLSGSRTNSNNFKVELATPILKYNDLQQLNNVVNALKNRGAVVNNSCGLHVHVGSAEFNQESLKQLLNIVFEKQHELFSALNVYLNREHSCKLLPPKLINKLFKKNPKTLEDLKDVYYTRISDGEKTSSPRRRIINLVNSFSKNSEENHFEFRMFNSTLDCGEINACVELCLALSNEALNRSKGCEEKKLNPLFRPLILNLKHKKNSLKKFLKGYKREKLSQYLRNLNMSTKNIEVITKNLPNKSNENNPITLSL